MRRLPGVPGWQVPAEIFHAFGFDAFTISNDKFHTVETLPRRRISASGSGAG